MTSAGAPATTASNLAQRVATAAVALPILVAVLFAAPPIATQCVVAVAMACGFTEFRAMLRSRGFVTSRLASFVLLAVAFTDAMHPQPVPLWIGGLVIFFAATLFARAEPAASVPAAALELLGALLLGALGGTIAALRVLDPQAGSWRLTLLLAIVMGSDTLAYFVGRALGRHRLAPRLSPGKTVEGAIGGLAGGVIGALVVRRFGLAAMPLLDAVGLGVAAAAVGMAGDLFESLLKRWAGVKDSGALFPGHGGMLDRLDSLLFAAPVLYYYFLCCPR